jgi:hypothetical protein
MKTINALCGHIADMDVKPPVHVRGFEVFTVVKMQVEFFRVVTPCSVVVGYQSSEVHSASIIEGI